MEVNILDSLYRRITTIDRYQSLIWTERYSAFGEVELQVVSTAANRGLFVPGVKLVTNKSQRVMKIETVEDTTDDDGRKILKIVGYSLERILDDRVARGTLSDLTATPTWILTGTPIEIAEQLFHDICVTGILDSADIIAGVIESDAIFPPDTNEEPDDEITYEIDLMSLYTAIKNICDRYGMGFRLVRDGDTSDLYWDVYVGSDRTSGQTSLGAVIFAPELDNLQNTTKLHSTAIYKNVAYVYSKEGMEIVFASGADPDAEGFERRVLFVKADDIEDGDPSASAKMIRRGNEELAKQREILAFDGELAPTSQYVYGTHYNMGDLVELRDDSGLSVIMRVTEQIFVSDKEGERSYPTLSNIVTVTPGSWADMAPDLEWADMTTEEWADMPS